MSLQRLASFGQGFARLRRDGLGRRRIEGGYHLGSLRRSAPGKAHQRPAVPIRKVRRDRADIETTNSIERLSKYCGNSAADRQETPASGGPNDGTGSSRWETLTSGDPTNDTRSLCQGHSVGGVIIIGLYFKGGTSLSKAYLTTPVCDAALTHAPASARSAAALVSASTSASNRLKLSANMPTSFFACAS